MDLNLPVLLYGIVKGMADGAIKDAFGQRRIRIDFVEERPGWARQISGTLIEIQTLFGEYGGRLGSATHDSEGPRAKPSPKVVQEREANIAKMMAIIQELASGGELTLMLQTTEFVPGRLARQRIALDKVTKDFLLRFPHDTIVSLMAQQRTDRS